MGSVVTTVQQTEKHVVQDRVLQLALKAIVHFVITNVLLLVNRVVPVCAPHLELAPIVDNVVMIATPCSDRVTDSLVNASAVH